MMIICVWHCSLRKGLRMDGSNPMVGAVIVKDGQIIGQGWHEVWRPMQSATRWRPAHAIRARPYMTLEPCCHYGKQPPCTQAILNAGIKRVVVGSATPIPCQRKRHPNAPEHGVEVPEGVLEDECARLNKVFFHYIQTKHPFVVMKYAMTLDGKIAAYTGASKWITGEAAREHRSAAAAI